MRQLHHHVRQGARVRRVPGHREVLPGPLLLRPGALLCPPLPRPLPHTTPSFPGPAALTRRLDSGSVPSLRRGLSVRVAPFTEGRGRCAAPPPIPARFARGNGLIVCVFVLWGAEKELRHGGAPVRRVCGRLRGDAGLRRLRLPGLLRRAGQVQLHLRPGAPPTSLMHLSSPDLGSP